MDRYSIIVVPPSGEVRRMRLSSKNIRLALWLIAGFILVNIGALGYNISSAVRLKHSIIVQRENTVLKNNVASLSRKADSLGTSLKQLSNLSGVVREMAGLTPISDSTGVLGLGGPQLMKNTDNNPVGRVGYDIDSLLIQTKLHYQALAEVCSTLSKQENLLRHTPTIKPMNGYITSGFGPRKDPFTGVWKMHEGVDIVAPRGTPVHASADGRVSFVGWHHGYGNTIAINHRYYITRYAHLDRTIVHKGQKVKRGDVIGTCGRSGRATGTHLHYEVRVGGKPVNPVKYIYSESVVVD